MPKSEFRTVCVHTAVVTKFPMDLVLNRRLSSRAVGPVPLFENNTDIYLYIGVTKDTVTVKRY